MSASLSVFCVSSITFNSGARSNKSRFLQMNVLPEIGLSKPQSRSAMRVQRDLIILPHCVIPIDYFVILNDQTRNCEISVTERKSARNKDINNSTRESMSKRKVERQNDRRREKGTKRMRLLSHRWDTRAIPTKFIQRSVVMTMIFALNNNKNADYPTHTHASSQRTHRFRLLVLREEFGKKY